MITAVAVEPDDLDSLAGEYGHIEGDVRDVARQALIPVQVVPRDPQIAPARLEDRLAAISAVLRSTSGDIEAHKRDLNQFADGVRVIDAGQVVIGALAAVPVVAADAVRRVAVTAWHRETASAKALLNIVEHGVRAEYNAVDKALSGVGRTIADGANDLLHQGQALQQAVDHGVEHAANWTADRWHDLTKTAAGLWHGLGSLAHKVQGFLTQLEAIVEKAWTTSRARIDHLLSQIPPSVWGAIGLGVATVLAPEMLTLVGIAAVVKWAATEMKRVADSLKRYGGPLDTAPSSDDAQAVQTDSYEFKVDVPVPFGDVGGSVSLTTTEYKDGSKDVTLQEEIFAGLSAKELKAIGIDAGITGSLKVGETWHFRTAADAQKFMVRLAILAALAELARTAPPLAYVAAKSLRSADPNLLRIPSPSSVSVTEGVSAHAKVGVPGLADVAESAGVSATATTTKDGHTAYKLQADFSADGSLTDAASGQGISLHRSGSASVQIEEGDKPGSYKVTLEGDVGYEQGVSQSAGPAKLTTSATGTLKVTKTINVSADQAKHLLSDAGARNQLAQSVLNGDNVHVEQWQGVKEELDIADGTVTATHTGEHLVYAASTRSDFAAHVPTPAMASGGGSW